ncbi:MAG TPA: PEP-utilizing enzyme [Solirubrobacteraceae bacterium]|nr:PEP-utilizing enzyme [Solirubrobacteraceae bacterium]
MSAAETVSQLRFDAPGPGTWTVDAVHFPRPVTRYFAEFHPAPFKRGFQELTRFYGMPIGGLEYHYIHGFAYSTMAPPPEDEIPARFQRAQEVWEQKVWREQLREWDGTFKPASISKHRELQAVDPDALSDADLVAYLTRCRDHHADMIFQHMRFTAAPSVPTGDFLAHVGDWTGLPISELLGLLRGSAPVSAGASDELARLRAAIGQDSAARELLASDRDPAEILRTLTTIEGETGEAASGYLDLVGYRLLDGFDIAGRYALEMPDALLRAMRMALEGEGPQDADVEGHVAEVREQVPEAHRAQFDELLEEARLTYKIRDERGVFSDIWAAGIMRRAALAAGRRLADRGRIHDPEHFTDAGFEEMCALVSGTNGPSADELAERHDLRTSLTAKDVPQVLGDPPAPPPDPSGLPPAAGRVMRAMGIVIDEMFGSSTEQHEEHLLRGLAASPGVREGIARRVAGPAEFDRIVQGDVLVTESTTEAFNILLPLLGGIVTDAGGLLSHAAIVAREYGIPGVVGTREGTALIPDGARVRVDGGAGEVTVLG